MSTTAVAAGQIMDRVANLLNDPRRTDYSYDVILPYLNMAIEELSEHMTDNQAPLATKVIGFVVPAGPVLIVSAEDNNFPLGTPILRYPDDLVEVQEVAERLTSGPGNSLRVLPRKEILEHHRATSSLIFWIWSDQRIAFNPLGATQPMEVQVTYLGQGVPYVVGPDTIITIMNSRSYLSYKTAALCAMFIGENETRAKILNDAADDAMERIEGINNKGRQQIMTRHRPFRASYKSRGGF